MWGNMPRGVETSEESLDEVFVLRSQNRRLKTKLADLEDLQAKTKLRLKSQLREKSKAKRGDPARFLQEQSRSSKGSNHKVDRIKKEYEELKKKFATMSKELRKTQSQLSTLKTTSRDDLARQKSMNAKMQKKLMAAEGETNTWKSKFENQQKKFKVQGGDLCLRSSNTSSIRSRTRTYSEHLALKKRNPSKSQERVRTAEKASPIHSRAKSSPVMASIVITRSASTEPLSKPNSAPRSRAKVEKKPRSKTALKVRRRGSMELEKERELQFSEKPKLPKWTPYVMSNSKSTSKKRKSSKKHVNKTKTTKSKAVTVQRGTARPRTRRNALVPFDLSVLLPEVLPSEAAEKVRPKQKKRKAASGGVPQVQRIKRKAAIDTKQESEAPEESASPEILETGFRRSVTDPSIDPDKARQEKFVADIRRQSEEILNSIKISSSPSKSSVISPPPRRREDLSEAQMQVHELRRKSIEMLEALESPTGLEDFQIDDADLPSPKSKDLESDDESEISDLEESVNIKSQKQIIENIQLPPTDEKSEFSSDYSPMRRESEELLTVIQLEEATSATRTPQNTPLPSQTSTPQNTPIIEPENSPLQRVRLELRKLSEDIMQKNVVDHSRSPSSDLVKSVLVMNVDHSMEIAHPHTPTADDEMDSFENLLEEERKGPLVDDMDEISDSLSDLENAAPVGDSSDGEDLDPQAYELQGAGSDEFNGVYRWFHATNSYVKFASGATYSMNSEPFGESAFKWYISKIDENNVLQQYYSSFHKGSQPPERWQSIIGELPAPTLVSYLDEEGEN